MTAIFFRFLLTILWELVFLVWEFLLFYRIEYPKRCLWKKNLWNFSMAQFLWYDCTFKKQCTVPVTLTFDLWTSIFFQWIEYNHINILYKFQIDISSNSWEIKYQNIGWTHTQTHTQTDRVKTIPRNPSGGEVMIGWSTLSTNYFSYRLQINSGTEKLTLYYIFYISYYLSKLPSKGV